MLNKKKVIVSNKSSNDFLKIMDQFGMVGMLMFWLEYLEYINIDVRYV